jgi:Ser/Thr protein kinase RdoA (MazF antagonist)
MNSAAEAAAAPFLPAARQAAAAFPVEVEALEPVAVGENIVFRLRDRTGETYVLRLHRPGYHDLRALNAERAWTEALRASGIAAPEGVRTRAGDWYVSVQGRFAGLCRWVEGDRLADAAGIAPADAYAQLGSLMARLHATAAAWAPPPGFSRHRWDASGLTGEAPFWGRFWESGLLNAAERDIVTRARDVVARALVARDERDFSLIHADLHPGNLLVTADGLAIIDFDDAGWGWHVHDMAVALFYPSLQPDFEIVRQAFLEAYDACRPLPRGVERDLDLFLLMRGLMLIGWIAARPEIDPANFLRDTLPRVIAQAQALVT